MAWRRGGRFEGRRLEIDWARLPYERWLRWGLGLFGLGVLLLFIPGRL